MQTLRDLGALNMQPGSSNDLHKRVELAKWLSDWHLVAFLGTTQLFSAVWYFIISRLCDCSRSTGGHEGLGAGGIVAKASGGAPVVGCAIRH